MNFFKPFAFGFAGVAAALALTLSAPKAEARTCFTVPHTGGALCNKYQGSNSYGDIYTLGYSKNHVSESMTVVCKGARVVDWESNGNMSQDGAQRLANYFCGIPD